MNMNSTNFTASLVVTLLFYSAAVALRTDESTNLKPSETSNKHVSSQLYVFGGYDESGNVLSSASKFNSSAGEWERITSMSMARAEFCGAVVGPKIHLFGGSYADLHATESAEVYDSQTGIFSPFTSMPSPRVDCGSTVMDGFIYVAGGNNGGPLSSVIRYNIQTTRSENVSSMNNERNGLQLVELNSRLYAIGGYGKTVESYNVTTDRWTTVASTHYAHQFFGAAVHEGKIYVCSDNGFEVYSPEADQWQTLTPPDNYYGTALVSMNGQLWALGGETGINSTKSVFTYNTSTKQWTQQANMDAATKYFTAFVVNDFKILNPTEAPNKYASPQLYVFGGFKGEHGVFQDTASQFNSSTGEWRRINPMSESRAEFCGAVAGTKIYLFGGDSAKTEVYDCETGIYSPFTSLPGRVFHCGAAVLNGFIYVTGDWNDLNKGNVIRYDIQTSRWEDASPIPNIDNSRYFPQLVELNGRLYALGGDGTTTVESYNATTDRWTTVASSHFPLSDFSATEHERKIYVYSYDGLEAYSPEADEWEILTPPNKYRSTLVSMNGKLWALGGLTKFNSGANGTKSVFTYDTTTRKWTQQADMDTARGRFTAFVVNH